MSKEGKYTYTVEFLVGGRKLEVKTKAASPSQAQANIAHEYKGAQIIRVI